MSIVFSHEEMFFNSHGERAFEGLARRISPHDYDSHRKQARTQPRHKIGSIPTPYNRDYDARHALYNCYKCVRLGLDSTVIHPRHVTHTSHATHTRHATCDAYVRHSRNASLDGCHARKHSKKKMDYVMGEEAHYIGR
jgi:DNA-directed RNA polymerase